MGDLTKWLKAKGVGVDRDGWTAITNVKFDTEMIEIPLGSGGEGRRGSNHANKVGAGYKHAGGSWINSDISATSAIVTLILISS